MTVVWECFRHLAMHFWDKDGKQVLPGARGLKDITEITAAYVIPELAEM